MSSSVFRLLTLALLIPFGTTLRAQPVGATFRPALLDAVSAGFTASGSGRVERGGSAVGDVSLSRFDLSVASRVPLKSALLFTPGLAYERTSLDVSAGTPLPETLQALTLSLGLRGALAANWAWGGYLRPGFYGDSHLGGDAFNAPLFLAAFYTPRPGLMWTFGVSVNAFNDQVVLPAAGVRWEFSPDWTLEVGFPRTGVTYRVDPDLTLRAGLSVLGGAYRISESLGVPAPGVARLANTMLDVTEVRVGAGLTYMLSPGIGLELDGGLTTLRRFEYPDRNFRLSGENVGWLSLAVNSRF